MEDTINLWFKEGYTDFDSSEGVNRDRPFELKRLNVIVGANNSGKSRFMRELAYKIYLDEISIKNLPSYLQLLKKVKILLGPFSTNSEWDTNAFDFNSFNYIINNYKSNLDKLVKIKSQVDLSIPLTVVIQLLIKYMTHTAGKALIKPKIQNYSTN